MKHIFFPLIATLWAVWGSAQPMRVGEGIPPFRDPRLSDEARAADLCSRLTIEEKACLLMHYSPAVDRLGIHQFQWWGEALHGVGFSGFATVFPEPIGMAASFDDLLLHRVFDAVSTEQRAKYNKAARTGSFDTFQSVSVWTPNINIFRDPRWGRGQETYGEDPYLTARMGKAVVRGLQGMPFVPQGVNEAHPARPRYYKTMACAKHFAVHSGPEWSRHRISIDNLPQRDFWETYMPAFKALVTEANVREVMCAYNSIDGEPCCSDQRLLRHILRDEWGFDGIVVSDCDAINDIWREGHHAVEPDVEHASVRSVVGGTDLNCGGSYTSLPEAVRQGLIAEERIDENLRRIIVARIRLGDFDPDSVAHWNALGMDLVNRPEHRQLALDMAHETLVLLHNKGNALPLERGSNSKFVVMGPNANDSTMLLGNYSGRPAHAVTILEGLREKVGAENVHFIDGCGYVSKNVRTENRFAHLGARGLEATIWDNTEMKGEPVAHRSFTSPVNFNLNESGFIAQGVARENFSVQLHGTFHAPETETLQFRIAGDDGFRLIVDGDTLVDEWRTQGTLYRDRMVSLERGRDYTIQIDYFQAGGNAELQFDINRYRELSDEELLAQVPEDIATVIFVGGISSRLEGEEMSVNEPGFRGGDRDDIQLPERQRRMLAALHRAGKRVVFVNCSGSAMAMEPELQTCDAILQAWYPGEQGGRAVADVLFGDCNPSGKLPVTFYRSVSDLPDFEDYHMAGRTYRYFTGDVLFPFGYGLSYTTFAVGRAKLKGLKAKGQNRRIQGELLVPVKNTGRREGSEVVQLYVRSLDDPDGPIRSLKGFTRVTLKPGERQTVVIPLTDKTFERFDTRSNTVRFLSGRYQLLYGTSSSERDLQCIDCVVP